MSAIQPEVIFMLSRVALALAAVAMAGFTMTLLVLVPAALSPVVPGVAASATASTHAGTAAAGQDAPRVRYARAAAHLAR